MLSKNPASSIIHLHPRFQELLAVDIWRQTVVLVGFGAQTPKPIFLYANVSWIAELGLFYVYATCRTADNHTTYRSYTNDVGQTRCDGAEDLKATQEYPMLFGYAVARLYLRHMRSCRWLAMRRRRLALLHCSLTIEALVGEGQDAWDDAELGPSLCALMRFLTVRA